ncbi:titin homolog isoform X2 [Copidosoma floridanum]|uniref:titin homolog isoform X2 n=1 Tax=Copidosoma floridanum TaxID=29053 RepID=UPI000C6F8F76|nr:titin homolog isoform X2 [Copidosoma floridanum]
MTLTDRASKAEESPWEGTEDTALEAFCRTGEDLLLTIDLRHTVNQDHYEFEMYRGEPPMPSDRFRVEARGNKVQLTLQHASKGDAGHYALIARRLARPGDKTSETERLFSRRVHMSVDEPSSYAEEGDPPLFLRRLTDLTVKVGTRTRFLVEIRSATDVKVIWHRNDEPIQTGPRFSFVHEGNFYCVDVAPVTVEDQGHWTCMAENRSGRSSCTSHLNVLVPKAYKRPEFVSELRALLTETGTVSLECKVIGVPTPVLNWFKDNKEIKAGDVFALTANPDDPTSLGTYSCVARSCMGTAYSSSRVHVVGKGSREGSLKPADTLIVTGEPPIFTTLLKDESCRIGESILLSCRVKVPPWPKEITWYNKEGRVEAGERYKIIEDGLGGYSIQVNPVEAVDEGEWKCVATSADNVKQLTTCFVAMSIPKNYRKPRFMESLKAVLTDEGLVSFECKVVGFPTPLLRWFKDGQELKPGDVYQLTGTNSLGSYCCVASSCMGEARSTAELTVEDIQNQLNEEERLQLLTTNQPPKFIKGLRSTEAKISENFRFSVQVSVMPEPILAWYRDDHPVEKEEKYRVEKETLGICHLEIKRLEFCDQAEWKCVASNDFGQSVTSCFLKLIIPKHYKKPVFLENLRAILSEGGAVNLECKVIGVPQPVLKWYKDGKELKPGDIHRITSGQDGTCCLGTYTVEASSCMGSVSSSASLLGFEDRVSSASTLPMTSKIDRERELARHFSLSTIHEERTSQLLDTAQTDHSMTVDDKGDVSFSFDGKEISVSLYETPDLTEEDALKIVEMYADQLSENVTEQNVVELPPMRFVKESSTSGNLLMEAVVIDVSPDYFVSLEEGDDLRTEADLEDLSIIDGVSLSSPPLTESFDEGKSPQKPPRRKSGSISSKVLEHESESYHSARGPTLSKKKDGFDFEIDMDSEAFADALSSVHTKAESSMQADNKRKETKKRSMSKDLSLDIDDPLLDSVTGMVKKERQREESKKKRKIGETSSFEESLMGGEDEIKHKKSLETKVSFENEEERPSSRSNKERLVELLRQISDPVLVIREALIDSDYLSEDEEFINAFLTNNVVIPVQNLCEIVADIETKALKNAGDRSLVQTMRISLLETIGGPTEELLRGLELIKRQDNIQTNLSIMESLIDPVDEIFFGLSKFEYELSGRNVSVSPVILERTIQITDQLGSNLEKVNAAARNEIISALQIIHNVLKAYLSSITLNQFGGWTENIDAVLVESLSRPLEDLERSSKCMLQNNSSEETYKEVDQMSYAFNEILSRLDALVVALEGYESDYRTAFVVNLKTSLVAAAEQLSKSKLETNEDFDKNANLPEIILDPLIDVQSSVNAVLGKIERIDQEKASPILQSELALSLAELRNAVSFAVHKTTTLKKDETINALINLKEPLIDLQLSLTMDPVPEELNIIKDLILPLDSLENVVQTVIHNAQTFESINKISDAIQPIHTIIKELKQHIPMIIGTLEDKSGINIQEVKSFDEERSMQQVVNSLRMASELSTVHFELATIMDKCEKTIGNIESSRIFQTVSDLRQIIGNTAISTDKISMTSYPKIESLVNELSSLKEPLLKFEDALITEDSTLQEQKIAIEVIQPIERLKAVMVNFADEIIQTEEIHSIIDVIDGLKKDIVLHTRPSTKTAVEEEYSIISESYSSADFDHRNLLEKAELQSIKNQDELDEGSLEISDFSFIERGLKNSSNKIAPKDENSFSNEPNIVDRIFIGENAGRVFEVHDEVHKRSDKISDKHVIYPKEEFALIISQSLQEIQQDISEILDEFEQEFTSHPVSRLAEALENLRRTILVVRSNISHMTIETSDEKSESSHAESCEGAEKISLSLKELLQPILEVREALSQTQDHGAPEVLLLNRLDQPIRAIEFNVLQLALEAHSYTVESEETSSRVSLDAMARVLEDIEFQIPLALDEVSSRQEILSTLRNIFKPLDIINEKMHEIPLDTAVEDNLEIDIANVLITPIGEFRDSLNELYNRIETADYHDESNKNTVSILKYLIEPLVELQSSLSVVKSCRKTSISDTGLLDERKNVMMRAVEEVRFGISKIRNEINNTENMSILKNFITTSVDALDSAIVSFQNQISKANYQRRQSCLETLQQRSIIPLQKLGEKITIIKEKMDKPSLDTILQPLETLSKQIQLAQIQFSQSSDQPLDEEAIIEGFLYPAKHLLSSLESVKQDLSLNLKEDSVSLLQELGECTSNLASTFLKLQNELTIEGANEKFSVIETLSAVTVPLNSIKQTITEISKNYEDASVSSRSQTVEQIIIGDEKSLIDSKTEKPQEDKKKELVGKLPTILTTVETIVDEFIEVSKQETESLTTLKFATEETISENEKESCSLIDLEHKKLEESPLKSIVHTEGAANKSVEKDSVNIIESLGEIPDRRHSITASWSMIIEPLNNLQQSILTIIETPTEISIREPSAAQNQVIMQRLTDLYSSIAAMQQIVSDNSEQITLTSWQEKSLPAMKNLAVALEKLGEHLPILADQNMEKEEIALQTSEMIYSSDVSTALKTLIAPLHDLREHLGLIVQEQVPCDLEISEIDLETIKTRKAIESVEEITYFIPHMDEQPIGSVLNLAELQSDHLISSEQDIKSVLSKYEKVKVTNESCHELVVEKIVSQEGSEESDMQAMVENIEEVAAIRTVKEKSLELPTKHVTTDELSEKVHDSTYQAKSAECVRSISAEKVSSHETNDSCITDQVTTDKQKLKLHTAEAEDTENIEDVTGNICDFIRSDQAELKDSCQEKVMFQELQTFSEIENNTHLSCVKKEFLIKQESGEERENFIEVAQSKAKVLCVDDTNIKDQQDVPESKIKKQVSEDFKKKKELSTKTEDVENSKDTQSKLNMELKTENVTQEEINKKNKKPNKNLEKSESIENQESDAKVQYPREETKVDDEKRKVESALWFVISEPLYELQEILPLLIEAPKTLEALIALETTMTSYNTISECLLNLKISIDNVRKTKENSEHKDETALENDRLHALQNLGILLENLELQLPTLSKSLKTKKKETLVLEDKPLLGEVSHMLQLLLAPLQKLRDRLQFIIEEQNLRDYKYVAEIQPVIKEEKEELRQKKETKETIQLEEEQNLQKAEEKKNEKQQQVEAEKAKAEQIERDKKEMEGKLRQEEETKEATRLEEELRRKKAEEEENEKLQREEAEKVKAEQMKRDKEEMEEKLRQEEETKEATRLEEELRRKRADEEENEKRQQEEAEKTKAEQMKRDKQEMKEKLRLEEEMKESTRLEEELRRKRADEEENEKRQQEKAEIAKAEQIERDKKEMEGKLRQEEETKEAARLEEELRRKKAEEEENEKLQREEAEKVKAEQIERDKKEMEGKLRQEEETKEATRLEEELRRKKAEEEENEKRQQEEAEKAKAEQIERDKKEMEEKRRLEEETKEATRLEEEFRRKRAEEEENEKRQQEEAEKAKAEQIERDKKEMEEKRRLEEETKEATRLEEEFRRKRAEEEENKKRQQEEAEKAKAEQIERDKKEMDEKLRQEEETKEATRLEEELRRKRAEEEENERRQQEEAEKVKAEQMKRDKEEMEEKLRQEKETKEVSRLEEELRRKRAEEEENEKRQQEEAEKAKAEQIERDKKEMDEKLRQEEETKEATRLEEKLRRKWAEEEENEKRQQEEAEKAKAAQMEFDKKEMEEKLRLEEDTKEATRLEEELRRKRAEEEENEKRKQEEAEKAKAAQIERDKKEMEEKLRQVEETKKATRLEEELKRKKAEEEENEKRQQEEAEKAKAKQMERDKKEINEKLRQEEEKKEAIRLEEELKLKKAQEKENKIRKQTEVKKVKNVLAEHDMTEKEENMRLEEKEEKEAVKLENDIKHKKAEEDKLKVEDKKPQQKEAEKTQVDEVEGMIKDEAVSEEISAETKYIKKDTQRLKEETVNITMDQHTKTREQEVCDRRKKAIITEEVVSGKRSSREESNLKEYVISEENQKDKWTKNESTLEGTRRIRNGVDVARAVEETTNISKFTATGGSKMVRSTEYLSYDRYTIESSPKTRTFENLYQYTNEDSLPCKSRFEALKSDYHREMKFNVDSNSSNKRSVTCLESKRGEDQIKESKMILLNDRSSPTLRDEVKKIDFHYKRNKNLLSNCAKFNFYSSYDGPTIRRVGSPISFDYKKSSLCDLSRLKHDVLDTHRLYPNRKNTFLSKSREDLPRSDKTLRSSYPSLFSGTSILDLTTAGRISYGFDFSKKYRAYSNSFLQYELEPKKKSYYGSHDNIKKEFERPTYTPKSFNSNDYSLSVSESLALSRSRRRFESRNPTIIYEGKAETKSSKTRLPDRMKGPTFCTKLTNCTVAEGSHIRLMCTVIGQPEPQVHWTKNGDRIRPGGRERVKYENGIATLEIISAELEDAGYYTCVATDKNSYGQSTTEATVRIYSTFEYSPLRPTFTSALRDKYRLSDKELILETRVRGQPTPSVSWLKDERPLKGGRYRQSIQDDGFCRLHISNPDVSDSGQYVCKASNDKNADKIHHMVHFDDFKNKRVRREHKDYVFDKRIHDLRKGREKLPKISTSLSDYKVPAGGTIALQVEIKDTSTPNVTWLRDRGERKEIITSPKIRTYAESGVYTLVVPEATEGEAGTYIARVSNAYGHVDTSATVEVIPLSKFDDLGKPAMFISRPVEKVMYVTSGEPVSISFRMSGTPRPRVVWMKGIRDITDGPRSHKEIIDDYVRLTLNRVNSDDEGTYCILVKNIYGCDRLFFTLKIKQRARSLTPTAERLSLSDRLSDIHIKEQESYLRDVPGPISTEPIVTDGGRNWLSLSWGKADQRGPAPVIAYRVDAWQLGGDGGARWVELGISPINSFDAFNLRPGGEYKFRVTPRNRYGWGESVTMKGSATVSDNVEIPEFVRILPGQLKALAGTTVNLECEVRSDSKFDVKWLREATVIDSSLDSKYVIKNEKSRCSLVLENVSDVDTGRYICQVSNKAGQVSSYGRVLVVCDPKILSADERLKKRFFDGLLEDGPPCFTMRLRDRRVQTSYPVRLTCQVHGYPAPEISWFKDGMEIHESSTRSMYNDESHFHTLEITRSSLEDSGTYEVCAKNANGSVSCRCMLVVDKGIRAYIAPEFLYGLDIAYAVKVGGELRLTAQIEAYPSVGVAWHRDGIRLRPSRRAAMSLSHDGTVELVLAKITARDAGVYTVVASNEVGKAETSTTVSIVGSDDGPNASDQPQVLVNPPDTDVPYSKAPLFVTKPLSTEAQEGDTVIIQCEVVGDPKPEVAWLRDFLKPDYYRDAPHFRRVGDGPQYSLEIPHAKLDYTGAYSVVARNEHGEAKAVISLQIYAKGLGKGDSMDQSSIKQSNVLSVPVITKELKDMRCCDGDAVTLECKVYAPSETPNIRWEKSGKPLVLSGDFSAEFNGETAKLAIRHVYPEDEGEYTCVALNELGKAFTSACLVVDVPEGKENVLSQPRLTRPQGLLSANSTPRSTPRSTPVRSLSPGVTRGRELKALNLPRRIESPGSLRYRKPKFCPPKFYTIPHNRVAEEGETIRFQCSVTGHPIPWCSWDKDGEPVTPSARISIKEKDDIKTLEIAEVTLEDAGLYRVTLENDVGRTEASARLEVINRNTLTSHPIRTRSASPRTYPTFNRSLLGTTTRLNGCLQLQCDIRGSPSPSTTWFRNGTRLERSPRIKRSFIGERATLEISGVTSNDAGEYICEAKNLLGTTRSSCKVEVLDAGDPSTRDCEPPKFLQTIPSDSIVMEGHSYELQARISGTPPFSIIWLKDGHEIVDSDYYRHVIYEDGGVALRFLNVHPLDAGDYTLIVKNQHGQASCRGLFIIQDYKSSLPNTSLKFAKIPVPVFAKKGETACFCARIQCDRSIDIDWTINGKSVREDSRCKIERDGMTSILRIPSVSQRDCGEVRCIVSISRGPSISSSAQLRLKPSSPSKLRESFLKNLEPRSRSLSRIKDEGSQKTNSSTSSLRIDGNKENGKKRASSFTRLTSRTRESSMESVREKSPLVKQLPNGLLSGRSFRKTVKTDQTHPKGNKARQENKSKFIDTKPMETTTEPIKKVHVNIRPADRVSVPEMEVDEIDESIIDILAKENIIVPIESNPSNEEEEVVMETNENNSSKTAHPVRKSSREQIVLINRISSTKNSRCSPDFDIIDSKHHNNNNNLNNNNNNNKREEKYKQRLVKENRTPLLRSYDRKLEKHIVSEPKKKVLTGGLNEVPAMVIRPPDDVVALRGSTIELMTIYQGYPEPYVKWMRAGRELVLDERTHITSGAGLSRLTLNDITADQAGKYAIALENALGSDCRFVSVAVEGPPEPPCDPPIVSPVRHETDEYGANVTWCSPAYDGGCALTGYTVEYRRIGELSWRVVAENCHSLGHEVWGLRAGATYLFRVRAVNVHGPGEPSPESRPFKLPFIDMDDAVNKLKVEEDLAIMEDENDDPDAMKKIVVSEERHLFQERYSLHEELGKGRYGVVRRVIENQSKKPYAAKFVRTIKSSDRQLVREEMKIMNMLRHPKLLRLTAAFESPKEIVMITEYISGGELFERVVADDFTLTEKDSILFMRQICEGVKYMHENNVVHLDLKPENILCHTRTSHRIKLIDFGLAQILTPKKPTRVLFGTPEFIPPEIINYEPISTESDMWSVGVICYVLLTGLSPFMGSNDAETFSNIVRADYDFEDESFDAISPDAKDFISNLLQKKKELRMSAKQCLSHSWLAQHMENMSRVVLPKDKLKTFVVRRKWQKTGNALRALGRLVMLSANRRDSSVSSTTTRQLSHMSSNESMESETDDDSFGKGGHRPLGRSASDGVVIMKLDKRKNSVTDSKYKHEVEDFEEEENGIEGDFVSSSKELAHKEPEKDICEISLEKDVRNNFEFLAENRTNSSCEGEIEKEPDEELNSSVEVTGTMNLPDMDGISYNKNEDTSNTEIKLKEKYREVTEQDEELERNESSNVDDKDKEKNNLLDLSGDKKAYDANNIDNNSQTKETEKINFSHSNRIRDVRNSSLDSDINCNSATTFVSATSSMFEGINQTKSPKIVKADFKKSNSQETTKDKSIFQVNKDSDVGREQSRRNVHRLNSQFEAKSGESSRLDGSPSRSRPFLQTGTVSRTAKLFEKLETESSNGSNKHHHQHNPNKSHHGNGNDNASQVDKNVTSVAPSDKERIQKTFDYWKKEGESVVAK